MYNIEDVLLDIPQKTTISPEELELVKIQLADVQAFTEEAGIRVSHTKAVIIGLHFMAFIRRVKNKEFLPELEEGMFDELSPECITISKRVLTSYLATQERVLDDAEIFYLAVHFEAAKYDEE
jgi:PRD domain protein (TIGR03582 family)